MSAFWFRSTKYVMTSVISTAFIDPNVNRAQSQNVEQQDDTNVTGHNISKLVPQTPIGPDSEPLTSHTSSHHSETSASSSSKLTTIYLERTARIALFLETFDDYVKNNTLTYNSHNQETEQEQNGIDLDELMKKVNFYNTHCTLNNLAEPFAMHTLVSEAGVLTRRQFVSEPLSELELMRLQGEERRYQSSVQRSIPFLRPTREVTDTLAGSMNSLGMGVNLLLGLFLTFLIGFYAALYVGYFSQTASLLCGLGFSFICTIIEAVLLILYDYKLTKKTASAKQKRVKYTYSAAAEKESNKPTVVQNNENNQCDQNELLMQNVVDTTIRRRRQKF